MYGTRWIQVAMLAGTFVAGAASLGALRAANAEAQAAPFRECFAVRVYSVSTNEVHEGRVPQTTRLPQGWTPLAGGQAGNDPAVILCR